MSHIGPATDQPPGRTNGVFSWIALRLDPLMILIVALMVMSRHFWSYRMPSTAMHGVGRVGDFCFGSFIFIVIFVCGLVVLEIRQRYEVRARLASTADRRYRRFWKSLVLVAAAMFIFLHWNVPMQVCFRLSRPAFEALANDALADPAHSNKLVGQRAGMYPIMGVKVIGKTVLLSVAQRKFQGIAVSDRPNEGYDFNLAFGFARVPGARADIIYNMPELPDTKNLPGYHRDFPEQDYFLGKKGDCEGERIADDWFVFYSSYLRAKTGPS
jgi:hypothetical protein